MTPEEEQRRYTAAYERAGAELVTARQTSTPTAPSPPGRSFTDVLAPRVIARGDRGTWSRTTIAGQLAAVCQPDDPAEAAEEMRAAREFIDRHEFVYGRRPAMTEARLAVGRRSDGVVIAGEEQIRAAFRQAGVPISFIDAVEALPDPAAVTVTRG